MSGINPDNFQRSGLSQSALSSLISGTLTTRMNAYEKLVSQCEQCISSLETVASGLDSAKGEFNSAYQSDEGTTKTRVTGEFDSVKGNIDSAKQAVNEKKQLFNAARAFYKGLISACNAEMSHAQSMWGDDEDFDKVVYDIHGMTVTARK